MFPEPISVIRFVRAMALTMLILCTIPATALASTCDESTRRPNVILILADDLGWSDTTLYGQTRFHQTPNLQRLADRGMLLLRAYSASPLCSPTRSAILTGLSPARTGITTPNGHVPQVVLEASVGRSATAAKKVVMPAPVTRLRTEYRTLAESLKEAGYATGHFGKWHLGTEPYSPLQHGFDVDIPHHHGPGPAGSYVAPWKFRDFDHDPHVPDQHIEDRMASEASAFIEHNKDRPFFLNYWMFSVHAPFDAKRSLIEKYRQRVDPADEQQCPTYAAMIESMDDAIGTLLDTLDRLNLSEQTIIVFTSDNGGNMYSDVDGTVPTSNRPLRGGKATVFEGGVHVPGIVVMPGVTRPGSQCSMPIQSEDYYPTLLEALNLRPSDDQSFDGVSVLPALKGQSMNRPPTFTYFPHDPSVPDSLPPAVAIHKDDWKLIRVFHDGKDHAHRYLLFDLKSDPSEQHNLAETNPQQVKELDQLIEAFLDDTQAVVPIPNPAFDPAQAEVAAKTSASAGKRKTKQNVNTAKADDNDPASKGWKARSCHAVVTDGIVTITPSSNAAFLGFAAGKLAEGSVLRARIQATSGSGRVVWIPADKSLPEATVQYEIPQSEWTEIEVPIPARGASNGIVRFFLPSQDEKIRIDWIEIQQPPPSTPRRSDF